MFNNNFDMNYGCCQMNQNDMCCPTISKQECCEDPVYEAPIEKCIKKDFVHEIVHVCPIHTKVVNNHIYKHTYVPEYTCSEENICTNYDDGCNCNKF